MKTPALSPRWLLLWALRLAALPLALHLLGARHATSVISGTLAEPWRMGVGVAYAVSYYLAVMFAPALALAAGLAALARPRLR